MNLNFLLTTEFIFLSLQIILSFQELNFQFSNVIEPQETFVMLLFIITVFKVMFVYAQLLYRIQTCFSSCSNHCLSVHLIFQFCIVIPYSTIKPALFEFRPHLSANLANYEFQTYQLDPGNFHYTPFFLLDHHCIPRHPYHLP